MAHQPVLLHEVINGFQPAAGKIYLDATIGSGGHALAISQKLGPTGRIIGLDQDSTSLEKARKTLNQSPSRVDLRLSNFRVLDQILEKLGVEMVDFVLFDLGVHSDQFDQSGRGFSFRFDEPLLMTMKKQPPKNKLTARDIVNTWPVESLTDTLRGYGEERFAAEIAAAIVQTRRSTPIETTFQLTEIIKKVVPAWYQRRKIHPATKTFQALRIAVNDELDSLREGLVAAWRKLAPTGRLAVISFQSLEAKIVKNFFKNLTMRGEGKIITKHVIRPSWSEVQNNPRARSAQLRLIQKL